MKAQELELRFKDLSGLNFARLSISEYLKNFLADRYVQVEIALQEAINNALFHGPDNRFVTLKLYVVNGKHLTMRVRNEGVGFNVRERLRKQEETEPTEAMLFSTSGRGLFIMQAMTDRVVYNEQGTEVLLVKRLHPSTVAQLDPQKPETV